MTIKETPVKQEANRTSKGRFKKGISGNPTGRPRSESAILRERLNENSDEIMGMLMEKIREGDTTALRIAIDRILPPIKATAPLVNISAQEGSLADKANSVFNSAIGGEVPPDVASQMITALAGVAKIIEVSDLEQRITELEKQREH